MIVPARCSGWLPLLALCPLLTACDDKIEQVGRGVEGTGTPSASAAPKPSATNKLAEGLAFKDDDFVESERNRDPFRSFASSFGKRGPEASVPSQRKVVMPDTPVEDMRLIAVISGLARAKAMLIDKHSVGYVVQRGDYVGLPRVVQTADSVPMAINWRVDRIRENEVVLTRQDSSNPGTPPLSRIITMRDEIAAR
jgi:type IV pilus assembly protein PilP